MGTTTSQSGYQTTDDINAIISGMSRAPVQDQTQAPLPAQVQPGYRPPMPAAIQPPASAFGPSAFSPQPQQGQSWPGPASSYSNAPEPPPSRTATQDQQSGLQPSPYTNQPPAPPGTPQSGPPGTNWAANRPFVLPPSSAQPQLPAARPTQVQAQQSFIQTYGPLAQQVGRQLGVDPRLILGQWALESGWGVGGGAANGGNMAGIKNQNGQYEVYRTPQEFADAYTRFLQNPRYQGAIGAGGNADQFFGALKRGGYFGADLNQYKQGIAQRISLFGNQVQPTQNLMPPTPRAYNEWGRPPPGMNMRQPGAMPQRNDFGRIMTAIAPLLVGIASLAARMPLSTAITAYGAMAKAQQNGQNVEYQRNRTLWQDRLKEHNAQQALEGQEVGDAFTTYGDNNPQGLQQRLMQLALQYNDPAMYQAAERGDINAVHQMQQRRDELNQPLQKLQLQEQKFMLDEQYKMHEMELQQARYELELHRSAESDKNAEQKAKAAQQKMDEINRKRKQLDEFGVPPEAQPSQPSDDDNQAAPDSQQSPPGGGGGETGPSSDDQGAAPQAPAGPEQTAQAAPDQPTGQQTPAGGSPVPRPPPQSSAPTAQPYQEAQAGPGMQPPPSGAGGPVAQPGETGAQALTGYLLRGGSPSNVQGIDKDALNYAQQQAFKKRAQLDQALNSDQSGEDFLKGLGKIDPATGRQVRALLNYDTGLPPSGFGNRLSEYDQLLLQLAQKADPSYRPQRFASRQEFRTSFNADKPVGQAFQRTERLLQFAKELQDDAAHLPNNLVPINQLQAWFQSGIVGDPTYTKFITDWRNFAAEAQAVTNAGRPTVTLTSHMIDTLQISSTPAMVRQGLAEDIKGAIGSLDPLISGWHKTFRGEGNPEMFSQDIYAQLTQIANMNPETGQMPKALPPVGFSITDDQGKKHYYRGGYYKSQDNWSTEPPPEALQ